MWNGPVPRHPASRMRPARRRTPVRVGPAGGMSSPPAGETGMVPLSAAGGAPAMRGRCSRGARRGQVSAGAGTGHGELPQAGPGCVLRRERDPERCYGHGPAARCVPRL